MAPRDLTEMPLPLFGLLLTVPSLLVHTPIIVLSLLVRRLWTKTDLPLRDDALRSFLRGLPGAFPLSVTRYISMPSNIDRILSSPRLQSYRSSMCVPVNTNDFSAFWVYRSPRVEAPSRRITLLWIHGGAYAIGHALATVPGHMRLVEVLASRGILLDVFSLQYTLAPEATFPTQQREADAAYRYLLDVEGIAPQDVVVGGDSAGGHLALAFLLELQGDRPGGAVLAYPWVDLTNSGASFERNKYKCMLTRDSLNKSADAVLGGVEGRKACASIVNFAAPRGEADDTWKKILPDKTWVNVGAEDLFVDDVQAFCRNAERDGAAIQLEVSKGKCHGWQTLEDKMGEGKYLALGPHDRVPDGVMSGSQNLADGLLQVVERM